MKIFFIVTLFMTSLVFAQENQKEQLQQQGNTKKMTTKDAKKSCKEEGKTGAELIKCMKEKKEEK